MVVMVWCGDVLSITMGYVASRGQSNVVSIQSPSISFMQCDTDETDG